MSIIDKTWIGIQRRFGRQRIRKFALGSIPFIVLIGTWQANSTFGWLPPVFIPELGAVWEAAFTLQEDCPGIGAAFVQPRQRGALRAGDELVCGVPAVLASAAVQCQGASE